jgi:hypothetical protein
VLNFQGIQDRHQPKSRLPKAFFGSFLLLLCCSMGASLPSTDVPVNFFTNVAARLLTSQLNVDLAHLQIYPSNHYTPAVHRLLQFTANLYDTTTNRSLTGYPFVPTVFRPLFHVVSNGSEIYLNGFEEVTDLSILQAHQIDLSDPTARSSMQANDIPFGFPVIIGAKKGFPNFNEFSLQNAFQIRRRLQFLRSVPSAAHPTSTNEMFLVSITNIFGVEAWNSYSNTFPRDLEIRIGLDITATLTNQTAGILFSNRVSQGAVMSVPSNTWSGYLSPATARFSFRIPINTNFTFLGDSTFKTSPPYFVARTDMFEANQGFYYPDWFLTLRSRLGFVIVDTKANRIVDYVNIESSEDPLNIQAQLTVNASIGGNADSASTQNLWVTNRLGGSSNSGIPTWGVLSQMEISEGNIDAGQWNSANFDPTAGQDKTRAINGFYYNLMGVPRSGDLGPYYRSNVFNAPYVPIAARFSHVNWQANDPLLHALITDLRPSFPTNNVTLFSDNPPLSNLGAVNPNYSPWGRSGTTFNPYDATLKDPLIRHSDDWDFPTNSVPSPDILGRVHRGTPWQTLYLKSDLAPISSWQKWTGVSDPNVAQQTHPINDWKLATFLADWMNSNSPAFLLSPNDPSQEHWQSAFAGLEVYTNVVSDSDFQNDPAQPARVEILQMTSNSPQAMLLSQAVQSTRAAQGGTFKNPGDIFAIPELNLQSPWLNTNGDLVTANGIPDTAYEKIPSQLLLKLGFDSTGQLTPLSNGSFQLTFSGLEDHSYSLERSSNLVDWLSASTNLVSNGTFQTIVPRLNDTSMFYRSRALP